MRRTWIIGAVVLAACGSKESRRAKPGAAPAPAAADVSITADPGDRVMVARVDGVPVYGDCVERQAAAHHLDKRAALEECIDFQLLAGEADRKGYRTNPAVLDARKNEMARALIDDQFLAHFSSPEDIPESDLRAAYAQLEDHEYVRPVERRETQYARIKMSEKTPTWKPKFWAAMTMSWFVYWHFQGQHDLTEGTFLREAAEVAAPWEIAHEKYPFSFPQHSRIQEVYSRATWEIPEPGMVHAPIRSRWGFDVILLVDILPSVNISFEQAIPDLRQKIFARSRLLAFVHWSESLYGGKPAIDDGWLFRLAKVDEERAHLLEPSGAGGQ